MNTLKKDTTIAWFAALCFFLSTIEYMIPKPLPFLRLGLANLPVMLAIGVLPFGQFCALVLIKVLGQGLIGGTLFSYIFVFSMAGPVASAAVMYGLKRLFPKSVSYIGISVIGAFASNAAQLTLARWYIFGESAWLIAPPFIAVGAVTGALLGAFANRYAEKSAWYRAARTCALEGLIAPSVEGPLFSANAGAFAEAGRGGGFWHNSAFRLVAGIMLILALLFTESLPVQAGLAGLAVVLVLADRSRIRILPVFVMSASIVLFNLFVPFGRVVVTPLGYPLTEGAILLGIKKALSVEGMVFFSRWMLKPGFRLPGRAGKLVAQAFGLVGRLTADRKKIDPRNLIASLDAVMLGRD